MPCIVETDRDVADAQRRRAAEFEATLCGILSTLKRYFNLTASDVFDAIDWQEVGVSRRTMEEWWKHHQAIDKQRREQEQREREKAAEVMMILNQLTPYQRSLLKQNGLDDERIAEVLQ